jgi:hypothetical protein
LSQKPAADPSSGSAETGKREQRQGFSPIGAAERHMPYRTPMNAADGPPIDRT